MGAGVCLVYVTITWLDSQRNMFSQNKYHETKQSYRTKQYRLMTELQCSSRACERDNWSAGSYLKRNSPEANCVVSIVFESFFVVICNSWRLKWL